MECFGSVRPDAALLINLSYEQGHRFHWYPRVGQETGWRVCRTQLAMENLFPGQVLCECATMARESMRTEIAACYTSRMICALFLAIVRCLRDGTCSDVARFPYRRTRKYLSTARRRALMLATVSRIGNRRYPIPDSDSPRGKRLSSRTVRTGVNVIFPRGRADGGSGLRRMFLSRMETAKYRAAPPWARNPGFFFSRVLLSVCQHTLGLAWCALRSLPGLSRAAWLAQHPVRFRCC